MDVREFEAQFKAREISSTIITAGISCERCFDCGFVWVNIDGIAAWCYCRCPSGKQKAFGAPWALPTFDYEMERLFKAKPFPVRAFIPSSFSSFKVGLDNKMAAFKNDLRLSEKFWSQQK